MLKRGSKLSQGLGALKKGTGTLLQTTIFSFFFIFANFYFFIVPGFFGYSHYFTLG